MYFYRVQNTQYQTSTVAAEGCLSHITDVIRNTRTVMLDLEEDFTLNVKHAGMYTYEEGCPNKLICFYKVEEIIVVLSLIAAIYYTHIHTDFMFG